MQAAAYGNRNRTATAMACNHNVNNNVNDIAHVPAESSSAILARISALPPGASRADRDALLSQLRRVRTFEALVRQHGSEHAAHAVLAAAAAHAAAAREREIAFMLI